MQSLMLYQTTEALENQDVFQWARHMGSVLENERSSIFEDEGFHQPAYNVVELYLSSLSIYLCVC